MLVIIRVCLVSALIFSSAALAGRQQPQPAPSAPQGQPAVDEWIDNFDGEALDESRWERFTFEGGSGKSRVEEGELRQRGMSGSRSGVRSKATFVSDRFIVEATLARVAVALAEPGDRGAPIGNAIVTVLFDGSGRNRIEWVLTSEGTFEAWSIVDGRGERLDNRKLATKVANPTLGIVRRGDEFMFMLNGQTGLQKTIKNMPRSFHVMLYGYGTSENNWDSVRVVTAK
ncbi:MAG TPA: hypothetical protein VNH22_08275 [Blastocatellia bacterium]|jgi:hypothetical protein|nr:hypothetical protein [Blastocatellia bacterium]